MREYQATRCHRQRCTRRVVSGHSSPCRRDSVVPKEYTRRLRFYGSFSAVKRPVNFPSLLSPLPFTSALPFSPLSLPLPSTRSLSLFLLFAAFCINHFISGKCRHVTTLGTRLMIFYPAWSSIFFSSTRLRLCSQKVFPPFLSLSLSRSLARSFLVSLSLALLISHYLDVSLSCTPCTLAFLPILCIYLSFFSSFSYFFPFSYLIFPDNTLPYPLIPGAYTIT